MYKIVFVTVILSTFVSLTSCQQRLQGDHVCEAEEDFPRVVLMAVNVPYTVEDYEWCPQIPPRCLVNKTEYRLEYRNETEIAKRRIQVCCKGYTAFSGKCVPTTAFVAAVLTVVSLTLIVLVAVGALLWFKVKKVREYSTRITNRLRKMDKQSPEEDPAKTEAANGD